MSEKKVQGSYEISPLYFWGTQNQTTALGTNPLYTYVYPKAPYPGTATFSTQYYVELLLHDESFQRWCKISLLFSKCVQLLVDLYNDPDALKEALEILEQIAEYEQIRLSDAEQATAPRPEPKALACRVLPPEMRPFWGLDVPD